MRIAFVGVSHWHMGLYLEPALDVPGIEIVAISDPSSRVVADYQAKLGCKGYLDYRALCDEVRPDFVFALGRHCEMAETARFLIDGGIPFALEKPCGLDTAEVRDIAARSRAAGAFAAVPLVMRNGEMLRVLRDFESDGGFQHMAFRFIAGFPSRYEQAGCAWMLDPAQSGGGPTINLAAHFFDLIRLLMGDDARVVTAAMSNASWGHPIEDYSAVALQAGGGLCLVETGYLYPAPTSTFDLHFAFRSPRHYFVAHDAGTLEIITASGERELRKVSTTNVPHYRDFVFDVLERAASGRAPLASLDDMVPIAEIVDSAYAVAAETSGTDFSGRRQRQSTEPLRAQA